MMPRRAAYRFGDFVLDAASRELRHGGAPISLPPKSFDCLVYLVEHHDRAVGRDELISAVWGRVDVSDALLAQTLLRARRAVGDTGSEQTSIRTVSRFGYQWVAALSEETTSDAEHRTAPADAANAASDAGAAEVAHDAVADGAEVPTRTGPGDSAHAGPVVAPPERAAPKSRRRTGIALVLALLALAALAWWGMRDRGDEGSSSEALAAGRVVVLPVTVAGDSREQAWVRLGAMDYIASRMRDSGGLLVLPSSQVVQLAGEHDEDGDALARRLLATTGARWVVQPRAVPSRNDWAVRLHLLVAAGHGDAFDVEARGDTVLSAAAVATDSLLRRLGRLRADADPAPTQLTERLQQIDAELLIGQLANARALLQEAVLRLPDEPALRLREGQIEFRAGRIEQAIQAFEKLLAGGAAVPEDLRARAAMGLGAVAVRSGDFRTAEQRYGEAVAALSRDATLDPTLLGNAYNGRGIARLELGDEAEAIADVGRARLAMQRAGNDLEVASVDTNLGMLESRKGNDTRAIQQFDRALATFERFGVADNLAAVLQAKAGAQLRLGQSAGALTTVAMAVEKLRDVENPILRERVGLVQARVYLANGRLDDAERALGALGETTRPQTRTAIDTLRLRLALERGADEDAAALARSAVAGENPENLDAETFLLVTQSALRSEDLAAAREWLAMASAKTRTLAAWQLAHALVEVQGGADADASFAAVTAVGERATSLDLRIATGCAHAAQLLAAGNSDRASAILGEVATLADNDYRIAHTTLGLYRALGETEAARAAEQQVRRLAGQRDPARPLVY